MTKPTVAENADTIVTTTMTETAASDVTDGHDDDDQRWAEAVIASLPSRSREARKALAEALLDGGEMVTSGGHLSGLEQNPRKSAKKAMSKCVSQTPNSTPHVSGTSNPFQSADEPQESAIPVISVTHHLSGTISWYKQAYSNTLSL